MPFYDIYRLLQWRMSGKRFPTKFNFRIDHDVVCQDVFSIFVFCFHTEYIDEHQTPSIQIIISMSSDGSQRRNVVVVVSALATNCEFVSVKTKWCCGLWAETWSANLSFFSAISFLHFTEPGRLHTIFWPSSTNSSSFSRRCLSQNKQHETNESMFRRCDASVWRFSTNK